MKSTKLKTDGEEKLRKKAEIKLKNLEVANNGEGDFEDNPRKLLHELQVHQVELEIQNEELKNARDKAEDLLDKYTTLFDFAPISYFIIDKNGIIYETNFSGAKLLEIPRKTNRSFKNFIEQESRQVFDQFLSDVFEKEVKITCELELKSYSDIPIFINVEGIVKESSQKCLMAVIDISKIKIAERELNRKANQLRALVNQLSKTEQNERKRLATALHGQLQQLIIAAQMHVQMIQRESNRKNMLTIAKEAEEILNDILNSSRSFIAELIPPVLYELGLIESLNWLISRMKSQHNFTVRLQADAEVNPPNGEIRFLIFECIQELLLNIIKHSGVKNAEVTLTRLSNKEIKVLVKDSGKGFGSDLLKKPRFEENNFGLFRIKERLEYLGGYLDIVSAPGKGTKATFVVPLVEKLP